MKNKNNTQSLDLLFDALESNKETYVIEYEGENKRYDELSRDDRTFLGFNPDHVLLIPNLTSLANLNNPDINLNLPIYAALNENGELTFAERSQQPQLTPFDLACYLADSKLIEKLLGHEQVEKLLKHAQLNLNNQQSFHKKHTAMTLLIHGPGRVSDKIKIMQMLYSKIVKTNKVNSKKWKAERKEFMKLFEAKNRGGENALSYFLYKGVPYTRDLFMKRLYLESKIARSPLRGRLNELKAPSAKNNNYDTTIRSVTKSLIALNTSRKNEVLPELEKNKALSTLEKQVNDIIKKDIIEKNVKITEKDWILLNALCHIIQFLSSNNINLESYLKDSGRNRQDKDFQYTNEIHLEYQESLEKYTVLLNEHIQWVMRAQKILADVKARAQQSICEKEKNRKSQYEGLEPYLNSILSSLHASMATVIWNQMCCQIYTVEKFPEKSENLLDEATFAQLVLSCMMHYTQCNPTYILQITKDITETLEEFEANFQTIKTNALKKGISIPLPLSKEETAQLETTDLENLEKIAKDSEDLKKIADLKLKHLETNFSKLEEKFNDNDNKCIDTNLKRKLPEMKSLFFTEDKQTSNLDDNYYFAAKHFRASHPSCSAPLK